MNKDLRQLEKLFNIENFNIYSDDENYYFSDPLSAESTVIFPMKTAEEIFKSMGTQAVAILKTAE